MEIVHKKITREKAKEKKLIKFFTGKLCRNGHISERYVNDGKCIVCVQERSKKYGKAYYQKNKERLRPIRQKWQENNRKKAVEYKLLIETKPRKLSKTLEKEKKISKFIKLNTTKLIEKEFSIQNIID